MKDLTSRIVEFFRFPFSAPISLEGIVREAINRWGVEEVFRALMKVLAPEFPERGKLERLAEVAFDLVPGSIREVKYVSTSSVTVPALSDSPPAVSWGEESEISKKPQLPSYDVSLEEVALTEWIVHVRFGYSPTHRTLFVYNPEKAKEGYGGV